MNPRRPEHMQPRHDRLPDGKIRMPERYEIKPNPLLIAKHILGDRMGEVVGAYTLDGVPATIDGLIRETNRLLKDSGNAQIIGHSIWKVEV